MDSEVTGSKGKRRRLWVAGGVGAVLVAGVLAGLVANGSRSGNASDIITFECSGQKFWFNKNEEKRYGDIENKKDKLVTAEVLKSKCNLREVHGDSPNFGAFIYTYGSFHAVEPRFWVLDDDGKSCGFGVADEYAETYTLLSCDTDSKTDELFVLRKD